MKKIILLFFALASFLGQAQLAVGSTAPNFTVTDIYGVSHTLYDYTSQGKSVVLKLSATWCGPCWSHFQAGHLSDLYYSYGPGGSDEIVVLYVEVDPNTNVAQMQGNYGNGTGTLGNWTDSPYPNIDSSAVGQAYSGSGVPRFYVVCPNNTIGFYGPGSDQTATVLRNAIQNSPGCSQVLTGTDNPNVSVRNTKTDVYCADGELTRGISAIVRGQSNSTITSVNASIINDGNVIISQDFSMTRNRWQNQTINFGNVTIPNPTGDTKVKINTVNTLPFANSTNIERPVFNVIPNSSAETEFSNITIKITLDRYGSETSWTLRNSTGAIVAQNPSYSNFASNGAYPQADINLNLPNDCYMFDIRDAYGDGMCCSYGNGGYEIHANGELISGMSGGQLTRDTKIFRVSNLSTEMIESESITLFPNPASDNFTINTTKLVNVEIVNMLGKLVKSVQNVDASTSVDVSNLEAGVYFVKVLGENASETIKLIKK